MEKAELLFLLKISVYFLLKTAAPPNTADTPSNNKTGLPVANIVWADVAFAVMLAVAF